MSESPIRIAISLGDYNGIGPEVVLKTFGDARMYDHCTPVVYGHQKVLAYHANILPEPKDVPLHEVASALDAKPGYLNVINVTQAPTDIQLGTVSAASGAFAGAAMEAAVADVKADKVTALVTAPIHKQAMQLSGFRFPGHTEFLAHAFEAEDSLMLLMQGDLRVGLVTNHLPVAEVVASITRKQVYRKIKVMHDSLRQDFGIEKPKIAVMGLNPHAGDGGALGGEEHDIITPAIERARQHGMMAIGPYSADGFWGSGQYRAFDAVLAMYHDQGLIPFKLLAFGGGVNFTAGLGGVRTSPDHGTAFDIAGKGVADPTSFRQALYQAIDVVRCRAKYDTN